MTDFNTPVLNPQAAPGHGDALAFGAIPLVSIVIPCYKQAHFLSQAIESALAQGYSCREILVVNDGSPDNTSEVAARYPGVRCLCQENQGLAGARNAGMRASRGIYIVFLDADDRLTPRALETGVNFLTAHPQCAFVAGECRRIDVKGNSLPTPEPPCRDEDLYRELLRHCFIWCPATVMYRKAVLESIGGFNPSRKLLAEDYELYLRIARSSPIGVHGQVVAEYRVHGDSMSRDSGLMLKSLCTILRAQRSYIKGRPDYQRAYRIGLRQASQYYGPKMLQKALINLKTQHNWKQAARELLAVLRLFPGGLMRYLATGLHSSIRGPRHRLGGGRDRWPLIF